MLRPIRIRAIQAAYFIYNRITVKIPSMKLLYTLTPRVMTVHVAHTVCYLCLALGINTDYFHEQHYLVNTCILMEKVKVYCASETEYLQLCSAVVIVLTKPLSRSQARDNCEPLNPFFNFFLFPASLGYNLPSHCSGPRP